jgi:hypothetical protein
MANITVSDLRPDGCDLFADSESFMQELTEQEIGGVLGGGKGVVILWTSFCPYW